MEAAWSRTRLSSRVEDEDLQHDLADERCVQAARFGLAADWRAQGVSSYPHDHHTFASRTALEPIPLPGYRISFRRSCWPSSAGLSQSKSAAVERQTLPLRCTGTKESNYSALRAEHLMSCMAINMGSPIIAIFHAKQQKTGCSHSSYQMHSLLLPSATLLQAKPWATSAERQHTRKS